MLGALTITPSTAGAQELRYSTTQPGNVIAVGNALGLSKQFALNGPGTSDSIGTFISLDTASTDVVPANPLNPWGAGTTNDWTHNGSAAAIQFPNAEVKVLYAELVWGGSYNYGGEDVSAFLDNTPVTLAFGADSIQVAPDPITANTINYNLPGAGVLGQYYMRSGDVTQFVKSHFAGTYSVSGVPATQSATINSLNAAGWTLVIAYRYDGDPIRNMTVFVGNDDKFVDENTTVDYAVSGFCAPPSGDVNGTIAIAAVEGDANRTGDQLLIAPTAASTFVNLSGPNNPTNNFFASQINGANGQIDSSGTFGTLNQDAANGVNVSGGRQSWDVTTVQVSSTDNQLFAGQTSAVLRTKTLGDSYMPVLSALAIDVFAPKFLYDNSTSSADKTTAHPGDVITFTAKLDNEGKASADHVKYTMALASGLTLKSFTTDGMAGDINGNAVSQGDLTTGVDMGNIGPNVTRTVNVAILVGQTTADPILLKPIWNYDYKTCANQAAIPESFNGKTVSVAFQGNVSTTSTSTSTASSQGGAGGNGNGTGSGSGGDGGAGASNGAFAQGGGFCSASPVSRGFSAASLVGFALAAGGLAARRRRSQTSRPRG